MWLCDMIHMYHLELIYYIIYIYMCMYIYIYICVYIYIYLSVIEKCVAEIISGIANCLCTTCPTCPTCLKTSDNPRIELGCIIVMLSFCYCIDWIEIYIHEYIYIYICIHPSPSIMLLCCHVISDTCTIFALLQVHK